MPYVRQTNDLPGGAVGREFVDLLITEVWLLTYNSATSDRLMMFLPIDTTEKSYGES